MFAEIVTAFCLLYLERTFADPSSLKSTKFAKEINFELFSDLTKILAKLSLFLLSSRYCCKIIGYSLPNLLNVVTVFPP